MQANNGRFSKIGVKVIAQTSARRLTVGDNPNGVQSIHSFAKPLGHYLQTGESVVENDRKTENLLNINYINYGIIQTNMDEQE